LFDWTDGGFRPSVGEEEMIVSPDKSLFFVATALMCSASLYGAELSSPSSDPMTPVFVGQPTPLTLPPGFPAQVSSASAESCVSLAPVFTASVVKTAAAEANDCDGGTLEPNAETGTLPASLGAANANAKISAQPISVGPAGQVH
jgi:hypothetical protein